MSAWLYEQWLYEQKEMWEHGPLPLGEEIILDNKKTLIVDKIIKSTRVYQGRLKIRVGNHQIVVSCIIKPSTKETRESLVRAYDR